MSQPPSTAPLREDGTPRTSALWAPPPPDSWGAVVRVESERTLGGDAAGETAACEAGLVEEIERLSGGRTRGLVDLSEGLEVRD